MKIAGDAYHNSGRDFSGESIGHPDPEQERRSPLARKLRGEVLGQIPLLAIEMYTSEVQLFGLFPRVECDEVAVLNLLRLANLLEYFDAIWCMSAPQGG